MKSIKRLSILCLLLAFSMSALADGVWSHAASKLQLTPPVGWKSVTPTDQDDLATWESPDQAAEITLSVSEAEDLGATSLDEFVALMVADLDDSARLVGQEKVILGSVEGRIVVIEFLMMGVKITTHTTVALAHERVYLLIGTCESEQYKVHKAAFDRVSKSILL